MDNTDYSVFLIKQFQFWKLQIFENQGYLGRCILWCDREDALDLTDIHPDEYQEMLEICKQWRHATTTCFNPDWHNYAFLGNETRHLHGHLVPRYQSKRVFAGMEFRDDCWGHNYQTDKSFITPPEVLHSIQQTLQDAF